MKVIKSVIGLCLLSLLWGGKRLTAQTQSQRIQNDVFWNTADGKPIYSQGGGIFRFPDPATGKLTYYWYGVHYREADVYRANPAVTLPTSTFEAVTCYSSADLVNWHAEPDVFTEADAFPDGRKTWVGRLGVAYLKDLKKYALFVQHGNQVLVALAQSPTSRFAWHQKIDMQPLIGTPNTGDQTVFTDPDTGKSYLIYSYGRGRNKIYVSEIGLNDGKVGLLDCVQVFAGASREGNCMFKYRGKYYMCASNIYGWDSSLAYYLVADNIRGPYTPANNMQVMPGSGHDYAHVTQTGFFVTVKGSRQETVIFCGDRWADFAGNGLGYNQWVPLSFDGDTPYFNSLSAWNLDARTGLWTVAADNNYAKNGSFEADRNYIPSKVKPVQEQLLGWQTTVLQGNAIAVNSPTSPVLNYFNTEADRHYVIGEKSLNITDTVPFKRKISQVVRSSAHLPLPDGRYTLTAKVHNNAGFTGLQLYAISQNKTFTADIKDAHATWQTITLPNILIKAGWAEIGINAEGAAGAYCHVDDVSLVRSL